MKPLTTDKHLLPLSGLFAAWAGAAPEAITPIPPSGSNRRYYRLAVDSAKTVVGTYGADVAENRAFLTIAKHLHAQGISVPAVVAVSADGHYYLQEDFGDVSLFDTLRQQPEAANLPLLKQAVEQLAAIQLKGAVGFDFSVCYPVAAFDRASIFWDLNYFKYCFLKVQGMEIDEVLLEKEFDYFAGCLLEADASYFMYRDFQSRNIMMHRGGLGFIDFQGGRRGPLQYDLASFVFQAKAGFSDALREQLLQHYLGAVDKLQPVNRELFIRQYYYFVLFRTLQVLAVYGFRGLVERKPHFIESIPYALQNIQWLLSSGKVSDLKMPYLFGVLQQLCDDAHVLAPREATGGGLTITVTSFAYKNGYPRDTTGHGGGYVFDCRGLNNPGRVPELRGFTGRDACIVDFLEKHSEAQQFLQSLFPVIAVSIDNYLARGFESLAISFGCTGGRHRSVYCAERTAEYITEKYPAVKVNIIHREL